MNSLFMLKLRIKVAFMLETINPFDELPEALVEEMLESTKVIGNNLSDHFQDISNKKNKLREKLKEKDLLNESDEISISPVYPTSCGIDGSYAIEKLVATDISAAAAVAIEGLTPPGPEKRYWPSPRHFSHVGITKHSDKTSMMLRGITMNMELQLASNAPHNIVFLDGSLTTPFIYIHQAIKSLDEVPDLSNVFINGKEQENEDKLKFPGIKESFESYIKVLSSQRSDKIFVGTPKYSTENKICELLGLSEHEDRGLLNFILKKDEFVGPIPLNKKNFHLDSSLTQIIKLKDKVIEAIENLHVIYYRPSNFFPVIRLEISPSIASNKNRLAILFEALKIQCITPSIMEPYPLYLADRMVKHLGKALPAIRKATAQEMSLRWEGNLGNMFFAMHGYRTEGRY